MISQNSADIPGDVLEFFQHWQKIGKAGLVPTVSAFLDFPPFRLQSEVAIVDVSGPADMRFRLFGTGLSVMAGRDFTGSDVLAQFHPKARAEAARIVWAAASQPCGYFVRRTMRRGNFETQAIGVGLPLLHEASGRCWTVGFSSAQDKVTEVIAEGDKEFIHKFSLIRWTDLGAGTPAG